MATKFWISSSSTSFNTAANWSDTAAPANGDTLIFNYLGTASVLTNLSTTLTTLTIIIEQSYVGSIGSIAAGVGTYLVVDGGTVFIGQSSGGPTTATGSPQIMIDGGISSSASDFTVNVYNSSTTSSTSYYPPILVKYEGTSQTGNFTLNQYGGSVGIAVLAGETSGPTATGTTVLNVTKGSGSVAPQLYLGAGSSRTTFNVGAGTVIDRSNSMATTYTVSGTGTSVETFGTGAATTANVGKGATLIYSGTGTITTLNNAGTFDRTRDDRALTITNYNAYAGSINLLNNGKASSTTRTNPVTLVQCGIQDITATTPIGERF